MKSLGFIKEHDQNHKEAVPFSSIRKENPGINVVSEKLLEYLRIGTILIPMLHWYRGIDSNELIGPHGIQTDGEWIWPTYLAYYLGKGFDISIPDDFLRHVRENHWQSPELNEQQLKNAAKYYFAVTDQPILRGIF